MTAYSFVTRTIGCKVNQLDTAALERDLADAGFVAPADGAAPDVVVVNSCTVTSGADKDVRRLVSQARTTHPRALVVLTGCLSPAGASGQERAHLVIGQDQKTLAAETIRAKIEGRPVIASAKERDAFFGEGSIEVCDRARAFLKVQDGCDKTCAYCIIPTVRGQSRSREIARIVEDVRGLVAAGYREVVVTGVHLGKFGKDLARRESLTRLVRAILADTDLARLRLSSIEPMEVRDELIRLAADNPRLCPHFHIPLQSGDDGVLARMRRPYTAARYLSRVRAVAEALPDVLIGADVIVGFPGEDEAAFAATCRLVEQAPIHHLHVFPYSDRPGTAASAMDAHVAGPIVRARGRRLREIGNRKWADFAARFVGRELSALAIRYRDGEYEAIARNYLPVRISGDIEPGEEYDVRVTGTSGEGGKRVLLGARGASFQHKSTKATKATQELRP
ncbi:tRNA (N(6)-L-threonylcarbamoyladenosine(37)-C(2))-methylthiotransferase MtaB [bacterium]|nr:tRNA (N(6)-L-threonylcarbamoyladenosine(37)-C(2))-methylthiotransferase MtaB [bacterium]